MILVDTSVWVDHLRYGRQDLAGRLEQGAVACHPYVVGELACGSLANRVEILETLQELPMALVAEQEEILEFLERERLHGRGLGWIDAHLLASARLSGCSVWTLDKAMAAAAIELDVAFDPDR